MRPRPIEFVVNRQPFRWISIQYEPQTFLLLIVDKFRCTEYLKAARSEQLGSYSWYIRKP